MSIEVVETIREHFGGIRDPRQPGKVEHPLINITFLTICGVLCRADNWVVIGSRVLGFQPPSLASLFSHTR